MLHPLQSQVREISRQARQLRRWCALGWLVASVISAGLLVGGLDYLLRFRELGIRVLASAAVWTVFAAGCYRWLRPLLLSREHDLETARHVERRFPVLGQRLSSALAFLGTPADDRTAGSPQLRSLVITEVEGIVQSLDVKSCLERQPARRALIWGGAAIGLTALAFMLRPSDAALAAQRLLTPWRDLAWPRQHQLVLEDVPRQLAIGADLAVVVRDDNGQLPDEVRLHLWYDGEAEPEPIRQLPVGDRVQFLVNNVRRSFRIRATGGDDGRMPWSMVDVVQPPTIEDHNVQLIPPAYCGHSQHESDKHIRALIGTRVTLSGRTSLPIRSASLHFEPGKNQPPVPLKLSDDQRTMFLAADAKISWTIRTSGTYHFEMLGLDGLAARSAQRWEVRAVPDAPPTVSLQNLASATQATVGAELEIAAIVKDDFSIRAVRLEYRLLRRGAEQPYRQDRLNLFQGPTTAPAMSGSSIDGTGSQRLVTHTWQLGDLADLAAGDRVELEIVAEDYLPQAGRSSTHQLSIVSQDEMQEAIARRQALILSRLGEALNRQREARGQVYTLRKNETEGTNKLSNGLAPFSKEAVDQLQTAELNQRDVRRLLFEGPDSASNLIDRLLADVRTNRLDASDVQQQMARMRIALEQLRDGPLTEAHRELLTTLKQARELQATSNLPQKPAGSLGLVISAQDLAITRLQELLGGFSEFDDYRRFAREMSQLARRQAEVQGAATALGQKTLTRPYEELSSAEKTELKRIADKQAELALEFERATSRMQQMTRQIGGRNPSAARTLQDAVQTARRAGIASHMRQAASNVKENQLGRALRQQQDVAEGLRELLDVLANRKETRLRRAEQNLSKEQKLLDQIISEQAQWEQKAGKAAQQPAVERQRLAQQLGDSQRSLQDQVRQQSDRLRSMQADRVGASLDSAAAAMDKAAQAARKGEFGQAKDEAAAARAQLQSAQALLQDRRNEQRQQLVREQLSRLIPLVKDLHQRQTRLNQQVQAASSAGQAESKSAKEDEAATTEEAAVGDASARLEAAIVVFGQQQIRLARETAELAKQTESSPTFQFSLEAAALPMFQSARLLDRRELSDELLQRQERAARRLAQILESVERSAPANSTPKQGGSKPTPKADSNDKRNAQEESGLRSLPELKMARLLQAEILQQTRELEKQRVNGTLTNEQTSELSRLAQQQNQLAKIVLNLIDEQKADEQNTAPPTKSRPANLPDQ